MKVWCVYFSSLDDSYPFGEMHYPAMSAEEAESLCWADFPGVVITGVEYFYTI